MEITLDVAAEVDIARINPASPLYDLDQGRLDIVFTNRGHTPLAFPADAIMRRVIRSYQDRRTQLRQSFNRGGPPKRIAELTVLAPGESWRYGVRLELPDRLLATDEKAITVQVCVVWDKAELDVGLYPAGSYDWAESFSVCQEVLMRQ
ncbi:MAG: hypothetical protein MUD11_01700 [Rhodobacteraceae bacterium]|nr:hypothetical protein [Paracoccaceae bacterium]